MMGGTFFPSGKNEMHRGPSFCCGMLLRFTDSQAASGLNPFAFLILSQLSRFELNLK